MDDDNSLLAEFYYYIIHDESTYNQELNDLYVCYTLTRGLQLHSDQPRRPALPLEIVLRITRHAGFMDPKPALELTTEAVMLVMNIRESGEQKLWYMAAEPLSRVKLASMARIQLVSIVENPKIESIPHTILDAPRTLWAYTPLGPDEKHTGTRGERMLASLYGCANEAEARAVQNLTPSTIISDTFGPEHDITKQLDNGRCPYVVVIAQQPARLIIWKWWEPRF
ncbi:Zinc cluster transcriptional activator [Ceratobasidium sp. AG-Ba]|nr:Zinc cluster transcriptional activator [Ceratobasidium sp. AG-Ba]